MLADPDPDARDRPALVKLDDYCPRLLLCQNLASSFDRLKPAVLHRCFHRSSLQEDIRIRANIVLAPTRRWGYYGCRGIRKP